MIELPESYLCLSCAISGDNRRAFLSKTSFMYECFCGWKAPACDIAVLVREK